MNNPQSETLNRVAEDMFESLAFLLGMPDEEEPVLDPNEAITARIDFNGPCQGSLFLGVSEEMLPELATNMLGMMEETPSSEEQLDAFKELLNVICGNILPTLAGTEAVFNVSPAELLECSEIPSEYESYTLEAATTLTLDTGVAQLALFSDSSLAEMNTAA